MTLHLRSVLILLPTAALVACEGDEASAPSPLPVLAATEAISSEPYYCGGEVDRSDVEQYFVRLSAHILSKGSDTEFNAFVHTKFGVVNEGGMLWFEQPSVGAVTPTRIGREDWERIARIGLEGLQDAGYRGCFMDHGKVWFSGSVEDGFALSSINHEMAWE